MHGAGENIAAAVDAETLVFRYDDGDPIIDIESLRIAAGERVFIEGPSGSGKSTLLGLIGGILVPTSGTLNVLETNLGALSATERDRLRAERIGFVFQMFNLLPYLSLVDNVLLPCRFSPVRTARAGGSAAELQQNAVRLLEQLGLSSHLHERKVTELSIGQQQRVAAARALIGEPSLLIADEPTSALDTKTRQRFIDLVIGECERVGTSVLFVSHDPTLATAFDRRIVLSELNRATAQSDE
ncbi:MAG: ABC transporter ATP-binding protein [Pseudomonadota bacterium]